VDDPLPTALRQWREYHGWSIEEVVEKSRTSSTTPFNKNLFWKWQKGTLTPSYERLVNDVFPALGIDSLQKMLIFLASICQDAPGIESIAVIRKNEHSHDNRLGVSIYFAEEERVKLHPVRIDKVAVKPKGASTITVHHGYNYLLVIEGRVCCSFWANREKARSRPKAPEQKLTLGVGDAVAFPTTLPHKLESVNSGGSTVVVARPPWGRPDPLMLMYYPDVLIDSQDVTV